MRCWCSRVTQPRSTTKLFPSCYDITNLPLPPPHRLLRCRQHSLRTACVCYWNNSFAGKYVGRFLVLSEPCWHHLSVMLMLSSQLCTAPRSGPVTAALFPVSVLGIFFSPDVLLAQWWHDSPPVSQILIVNSLVTTIKMKLRFSLLVILLIISFSHIDARHRQKGAKSLHRSKRTIGDIINWKLNLIQSILGGIGGIFGGGKSPKPSYGPPRPQRPSYGARPQRPSYGKPRPSQPRPNYNARPQNPRPRPPSYNNQRPQRPAGRPQFGPSNAIKMLPAPNLATAAPPVSFSSSLLLSILSLPWILLSVDWWRLSFVSHEMCSLPSSWSGQTPSHCWYTELVYWRRFFRPNTRLFPAVFDPLNCVTLMSIVWPCVTLLGPFTPTSNCHFNFLQI